MFGKILFVVAMAIIVFGVVKGLTSKKAFGEPKEEKMKTLFSSTGYNPDIKKNEGGGMTSKLASKMKKKGNGGGDAK